jgi:hypothetical protein
MAFLQEHSNWSEGIYQLEVQDGPEGGPDGIDNVPLKQLADRTRLLYDRQNAILEEMPFGYSIPFEFMPTEAQLIAWRCLPLQGQVVQISLYQRLCDAEYVGDAANDTADWWYKTSDPNGTVRDVNGAYMRVLDHRGLFPRAAGQNSKYKMANDAPYDGGSIGGFIGDAVRDATGSTSIRAATGGQIEVFGDHVSSGVFMHYLSNDYTPTVAAAFGEVGKYMGLHFALSLMVPTALENRPASISAYLCIKY